MEACAVSGRQLLETLDKGVHAAVTTAKTDDWDQTQPSPRGYGDKNRQVTEAATSGNWAE